MKAVFPVLFPQPDISGRSIPLVYLLELETINSSRTLTKKISQGLRSGDLGGHGSGPFQPTHLFGKAFERTSPLK